MRHQDTLTRYSMLPHTGWRKEGRIYQLGVNSSSHI